MIAHLRRSLCIVALLLTVFSATRAQAPAPDLTAKVEEYMAAQMKVNLFSGTVLIAKDDKVVLSKGYGLANRELDIANGSHTKFRLGSITKQFTSAAILLLEEAGKLSTVDPICKYLDPCPATWQPVTIHHLLTHTSGIPSYTDQPEYRRSMSENKTKEQMMAGVRDMPLEFAVGEQYRYNNSGYFLLGMIIEKASGKEYADFLRVGVFDPLGMKDSGYDVSAAILPRRASGYSRRGEGVANAAYLDMGQPYAAGSLYSTVEDLYQWDRALEARKLLSTKSYEKMWTPFKNNYAYGWSLPPGKHKSIAHGGGINGFSTYISRYPDDKACVIVLSNLESGNAGNVARALAAILFGEPYQIPRERVVAKVDPRIYDAYVGKYELSPTFALTITREGDRLMSQATNQRKAEIFPESDTKFFLRVVDAQITFVKDASGKVSELILHQGRDQRAKKVE